MKWSVRLLDALRWVARISAYLGALVLLACVAMTVVNVIGRKFLGFAILGSIELTELAMVWTAFLTIPISFAYWNHIAIDFLVTGLNKRAQDILLGVSVIMAALVMAAYAWWGLQTAAKQVGAGDVTLAISIPIVWYWIPLIYGTVLSCLCAIVMAINLALGSYKQEKIAV